MYIYTKYIYNISVKIVIFCDLSYGDPSVTLR